MRRNDSTPTRCSQRPMPTPSNEPRSRSLTANELAMLTVGLDQLRGHNPAADELRYQLQHAVAVVLVEKAPF